MKFKKCHRGLIFGRVCSDSLGGMQNHMTRKKKLNRIQMGEKVMLGCLRPPLQPIADQTNNRLPPKSYINVHKNKSTFR